MARTRVRVTENFGRNLDQIEEFLHENATAFADVLDWVFDVLIPDLERFPKLGVNFLDRRTRSTEARTLKRRVRALMVDGDDLREFISGKYLVLFLQRQSAVYLLSIRHHRQLSFDLAAHWAEDVRRR